MIRFVLHSFLVWIEVQEGAWKNIVRWRSIKPSLGALRVLANEFFWTLKSSFLNNGFRILKKKHFYLSVWLITLHFFINPLLLFVTRVFPELLSGKRVVIEMVQLILIHWSIAIVMLVMAIFTLKPNHLTFFSNMFFEIWEWNFFTRTTKAFEIVTWAISLFYMSF